jgi:hypothetical protein
VRPRLSSRRVLLPIRGQPAPPVGRPPRAALQPRPWLERIKLYRPGLHSDSDDGSLASNESPLGASAGVVTAITGAALQAHRYPDPLAGALRAELAALHGVRALAALGDTARSDPPPGRPAGRVMPTHGDRITMIWHMVLLGAGAFAGCQRGDGFQLRLVLERGTHPRQPQITYHASACRNPQSPR